jgi:hypothetical protein
VIKLGLSVALLACCALRAAAADVPLPAAPYAHTYALLVGSNAGGAGQGTLRHAEDDALRMAELLEQLGRLSATRVQVLRSPTPSAVLAALDAIGRALAVHRARGEQSQFIFYYSGHARTNAIQMGATDLPLAELRHRILDLPASLTLIVLDACQSGAFSQVKGAQPRAAFSYNSVARLRTTGVAVMASSSASELSQESDALGGSYFTHHLMVGLRGAGDRDRNGVVSLAEAYGYAYERTLLATARTAVGQQHVTLETSLTGQGEVPITYPADAGAQLELPAELEADVLVERDGSTFAELHKVRDGSLRLALPAGSFTAVLRTSNGISECPLSLRETEVTRLDPMRCSAISADEARTKGYLALANMPVREPHESWSIELNFGLGAAAKDDYTHRLDDFGFEEQWDGQNMLRLQVAVARQLNEHFSWVADVRNLDTNHYLRDVQSPSKVVNESFVWSSYALGIHGRAHFDVFGRVLRFFAQVGPGLGWVHSRFAGSAENYFGPVLAASAGLFIMPFRPFGFGLQATYSFAPILSNELGDRHDNGGLALSLGIRYRMWSTP